MNAAQVTDPLFHTFRAPDTAGGFVRSYAHTWCQAAAVGHAVDALSADPSPGAIVLVEAQHHNDGDAVSARFELYREAYSIRMRSIDGDHLVASLQYGPAMAAADVAFHLLARKRERYLLFRQP